MHCFVFLQYRPIVHRVPLSRVSCLWPLRQPVIGQAQVDEKEEKARHKLRLTALRSLAEVFFLNRFFFHDDVFGAQYFLKRK